MFQSGKFIKVDEFKEIMVLAKLLNKNLSERDVSINFGFSMPFYVDEI